MTHVDENKKAKVIRSGPPPKPIYVRRAGPPEVEIRGGLLLDGIDVEKALKTLAVLSLVQISVIGIAMGVLFAYYLL